MFDFMPEFVPNAQRLAGIFHTATAPTFFLGAVAGFASLMTSRMSAAMDRVRTLNAIREDDLDRAHLRDDLDRLLRRAELLKAGIFSALVAGVFATLLLGVLFITEFMGLAYAYGAGALFISETIVVGGALIKFAREVNISLEERTNIRGCYPCTTRHRKGSCGSSPISMCQRPSNSRARNQLLGLKLPSNEIALATSQPRSRSSLS